jgi:hypothetical protein
VAVAQAGLGFGSLLSAYPGDEAVVGAVHRLAPGDELKQEDAEREHVRLLVHDAVREVLGRQAPVVVSASWLTMFSFTKSKE